MSKELTVIEATRRLGVSLDATYKLIYAGKLPATKVEGRWFIPSAAVSARLEQRRSDNKRSLSAGSEEA